MKNRPINHFYNIDLLSKTELERSELFKSAFKRIFAIAGLLIFLLSLGVSVYLLKTLAEFPDVSFLNSYAPDQSTQIFDINNNLVASIHADEDRISVPLNKISRYLQSAVISIEDNRFYSHSGIDLMGTVRAFYNNLLHRDSIQGGSTLTQQLVKNSFLTPERSIKRKFLEAILAIKVEMYYSKNEILEKYLNQIYWGNQAYGIEKGARRYFKKSAKDLNLAESSMLAGLIRAPELYSPYTNMKDAKKRQMVVLNKMYEFGFITKKQKYSAYAGPLKLAPRKFAYAKYIYFVDYVSYVLRKRYGDNIVRRGGLNVYTTLDPEVQQIAEKTITEGIKALPKGCGVREGALVSINVKNGYVQALVGGVDFTKSQFNRAVLAKRPVGSGFKPVVYLTGLRLGAINPESTIFDAPVAYRTKWNVWCPHNWDGKYLGKLTVRKALTLSRNTPTVRIALKVGVDKIIETARLLGIKSYIRRGFSMVLGSSEITPLEVAAVYSTLARDGVYIEPVAIRFVKDNKGNVLEVSNNTPVRVVKQEPVRELDSILVDVVEKGTGKSAKLEDRQVAGKTGTTDSVKDIWFNGFTPDTATTIWMGNDENQTLSGVFSSNCAVLWNKFSTEYYKIKKIPPEPFPLSEMEIKNQVAAKVKIKTEEDLNKKTGIKSSLKKQNYKNKKKYKFKKLKTKENKANNNEIKLPERTYVPDENDYENRYKKAKQQEEQNQTYQYPQQNYNNYQQ
ncbi:MAG: PBP1A family penicillin-binding protein [bacterium]